MPSSACARTTCTSARAGRAIAGQRSGPRALRERPDWFLTGPLDGRPRKGEFDPNGDRSCCRDRRSRIRRSSCSRTTRSSVDRAQPRRGSRRIPPNHPQRVRRRASRRSTARLAGASRWRLPTGWLQTPCMYFLGRMKPPPNQFRTCADVRRHFGARVPRRVIAAAPLIATRVAGWRETRTSPRARLHDHRARRAEGRAELADVRLQRRRQGAAQRKARIDDQDEAMRRHATRLLEDVAKPLANLERDVAGIAVGRHSARRARFRCSGRRTRSPRSSRI